MHGNVRELCLDWFSTGDAYLSTFGEYYKSGDTVVAPTGPLTGESRTDRGSAYNLWGAGARSGARLSYKPNETGANFGFRLVCPANIVIAE